MSSETLNQTADEPKKDESNKGTVRIQMGLPFVTTDPNIANYPPPIFEIDSDMFDANSVIGGQVVDLEDGTSGAQDDAIAKLLADQIALEGARQIEAGERTAQEVADIVKAGGADVQATVAAAAETLALKK